MTPKAIATGRDRLEEIEKTPQDIINGYNVNIAALHQAFSDVNWQNYSEWAKSQNWKFLDD